MAEQTRTPKWLQGTSQGLLPSSAAQRGSFGRLSLLWRYIAVSLTAAVLFVLVLRRNLQSNHTDGGPGSGEPWDADYSARGRSKLAEQYALVNENFPDPCFIESNGTFYAFATRNSSAVNIQVASASIDSITNWTFHDGTDALPDPGPWTAKQLGDIAVWAPSVVEVV
jgi:hypothetical protein